MKNVIGELTDSGNRAQGFALLPITCVAGAAIGYHTVLPYLKTITEISLPRSMIGDTLSTPHERLPSTFRGAFWKGYPYFLPCLTISAIASQAAMVTAVFFKEV